MSELGLVTPAGKVVWGKKFFTICTIFIVLCLLHLQLFYFLFFEFCGGCREIRTSDK